MDQQVQSLTPDYHQIYSDILEKKFPQKKELCKNFLEKKQLTTLEVLELNKIIFNNSNEKLQATSRKHRSYSKTDIFEILDFQKTNNLTNIQVAKHFKMSRNTIAKWKKNFL